MAIINQDEVGDRWKEIQQDIWECTDCNNIARVELNIHQQTELVPTRTKLLVVGIAPPHKEGVTKNIKAKSATNDSEDNFRKFIEDTLEVSWDILSLHGLAFLHAVKCAIHPEDRHQNPPTGVVDKCAPQHFYREFSEIQPKTVISFGGIARRAVLKMPGCQKPRELKLTGPCTGRYEMRIVSHSFSLFVAPFFSTDRNQARDVLRNAAHHAGIK